MAATKTQRKKVGGNGGKKAASQPMRRRPTLKGLAQSLEGTLFSRLRHMTRLGLQYGGERDLYEALGYKSELTFVDYFTRYCRQDIAQAIIDRPVEATWRGPLSLLESEEEDTVLETEWTSLVERLGLKAKFARADRLAGIGHYGVLLLGFDDVQNRLGFAEPVTPSNRKLLFVKPLSEAGADIHLKDQQSNSARYGLPEQYRIQIGLDGGVGEGEQVLVHHSRIIHIAEGLLENEVEGTPRLKSVYNRLMDLEKIVGGSAEMFWRGARPGYQGVVDQDYQMTSETRTGLQEQLDEYEHGLRRFLINEGVRLEGLDTQVADPSAHVMVQIQMISTVTGIPMRILTGSERGELASSEDRSNWLAKVQARREEFAEPVMVRPFVERCIQCGALPSPKSAETGYTIGWSDLWAQSEKEKAEVGARRAVALKDYSANPSAMDVLPPPAFYRYCLGLEDVDVALIEEMLEAGIEEEEEFGEIEPLEPIPEEEEEEEEDEDEEED